MDSISRMFNIKCQQELDYWKNIGSITQETYDKLVKALKAKKIITVDLKDDGMEIVRPKNINSISSIKTVCQSKH